MALPLRVVVDQSDWFTQQLWSLIKENPCDLKVNLIRRNSSVVNTSVYEDIRLDKYNTSSGLWIVHADRMAEFNFGTVVYSTRQVIRIHTNKVSGLG